MKCLHICNDFLGSAVHKNLYTELDLLGVIQTIFVPLRKGQNQNKNRIEFVHGSSEIVLSKKLYAFHRFLFKNKIRYLYNDLKMRVSLSSYDVVFATTLYSDGAIALQIKKDYNIPYIVAVRSTDVDVFMRYRRDLSNTRREILENASKIIFISDSLNKKFIERITSWERKQISPKIKTIYNGISPYWLDNIQKKKSSKATKLIYVGTLIPRKNIIRAIKAIKALREEKYNVEFTIIGGGGGHWKAVKKYSEIYPHFIKYVGQVRDISSLRNYYLSNDIFLMPSFRETFGLVYIEALSQGLPVLFSKNEGIDGLFEGIGERVDPFDVTAIKLGIKKMIDNYQTYDPNKADLNLFNWKKIANKYFEIFNQSIIKDE